MPKSPPNLFRASLPALSLGAAAVLALFTVLMVTPSAATVPTYKVKANDTLGEIATRNKTTPEALMKLNGITDPRKLQAGQVLRLPATAAKTSAKTPAAAVDHTRVYKVRKGDNLESIAKANHTTVAILMKTNGITDAKSLQIGQVLKLPGSIVQTVPKVRDLPAPKPAGTKSTSPAGVQVAGADATRQLSRTRINTAKWRNIVLHHSAATRGSMAGMDGYHRERGMENGLAYHFVIGNGRGMRDGELGIGERWIKQIRGGHVKSAAMNEVAIGICLVGNFEGVRPTTAQMATLKSLLAYLVKNTRVPVARIQMHRTINVMPTKCPGRLFPMTTVQTWWPK